MWHSAQGPQQRGDRLRALGGLSRSIAACSARRASSATCRARIPIVCCRRCAGIRRRHRASPTCLTARRSPRWRAQITRLQQTHGPGRGRGARRREPHDREDVPARQVRPGVSEDAVHRLQRPPVHGQRRRGQQEGVRHRSHDQPVVRHGRHRGDLGRRFERRRVLADHDQLHLAGARAGRARHRAGSADHAGRRGPATCICRSSLDAMPRCSPVSCRS